MLSRLYLGVLLSLALIAALPVLLGWHGTVVQSGSMEPHISAGDVVIAAPFGQDQKVPVGGVVEYTSPASAEPGGVEKIRLHRVVGENTDGTFVTAGDANAEVDSTPLERAQITGQARLLVPAVGLPGLWLGSGNFPALALWSVLTLLAVAAAVFARSHHDDNTEGDGTPPAPLADASTPPTEREDTLESATGRWRAATAVGIVAALGALVIATSTAFSSAAFTASTANAGNTFGTAADWMPPSVTLVSPGPTVQGNVTLTAEASDAESGIRNVVLQYLPPGGAWTTLCTATAPPYACAWDTRSVPDGTYGLRATATDNTGLASTSATVETTILNTFSVVLTDPGEIQRGTVNLVTTLNGPGTTAYTVRVEYSVAGANRWSTLCLNLSAPYNCAWNTTLFTSGESYDLRAVAISGPTSTYSAPVTDILVDNQAPSVTMTDPGSPLRGVGTFTAVATDAHSDVSQVQIHYARTGTSTWLPLCTLTVAPYSCRFDTATLANASYSFRAVATDDAGNITTSAAVSNRIVDNTASSVSVEDPGAYLTGNATLTAAANSAAGVGNIRIQTAPAGTATWTTRCTLTTEPYSCMWDTHSVPDGLYDFRAVLIDGAGQQTISTTVPGRRVDNSPLRAADVQAVNTVGIPDLVDAGDTLSFTYNQQVNLASVTPGWTGAALPVTVRLRDGNLLGLGNGADVVDIQRPGSSVNLGSVNTKANFVKNRRTATFNATMTATTVSIGGVPSTVVRVAVGSPTSGAGNVRISGLPAAMVWTPLSSVTSLSGLRSSTAPATERGWLDPDF